MPQKISNAKRMSKISTKSAIMLVSSAVGKILEDNPELNLGISIHVVSFNPSMKSKDNDHATRIMLQMLQVEALSDKKVQEKAEKFILKAYPRVKKIEIRASETHVNAVCEITTTPK